MTVEPPPPPPLTHGISFYLGTPLIIKMSLLFSRKIVSLAVHFPLLS